ncbi:DinB family protein [Bacillus sp. EAC]|uniref:DinB family protein n=1 Tax=Bacillus sp. EAC TaxID=1978338 RepID=UPI000B436EB0|nr:DinB family protein [Bacillus sp. EAC]
MNQIDLVLLNFEEIRRRSIKVWDSIPNNMLDWKPDDEAMSCAEMIRHVLESEYIYLQMLKCRGSISNPENPYSLRDFTTVHEDLEQSIPFRNEFISYIKSIEEDDLDNVKIDRSDVGYIRSLGDMLLRIAYHESIHTGQLLDYMRTMKVERPTIWD